MAAPWYPSLSSVSERSEQSSNIRSEDEASDALHQTPPALKEWPKIAIVMCLLRRRYYVIDASSHFSSSSTDLGSPTDRPTTTSRRRVAESTQTAFFSIGKSIERRKERRADGVLGSTPGRSHSPTESIWTAHHNCQHPNE